MLSRIIHVAVGVVVGSDGTILIAKRPDNAHQGGLWEFPGGKVEENESVFEALHRELFEELAIRTIATEPLIKIRHDYGDKIVLLDVHKVTQFSGEPTGNEGQPVIWVLPANLHNYAFPAANRPIITAINLPSRWLITGAFNGLGDFSARLRSALARGIHFVQLRVDPEILTPELVDHVYRLCETYSANLSINTSPDVFIKLTESKIKTGLHLNSTNLSGCYCRPVSDKVLLSASCHNRQEVEHAQKIGVDFICLSPVRVTQSHPEQQAMGWQVFEQLVEGATIPVYALGGMQEVDLEQARQCGAQGIAAISEWWQI